MSSFIETAPFGEVERSIDSVRDAQLLEELRTRQSEQPFFWAETGEPYANATISEHIRSVYGAEDMGRLETHLAEHGAFDIPIARGAVNVDGITHIAPYVAATETDANHGEMSSMLYLRDHIQTSRAYMELCLHDPVRYEAEGELGRELLHSALLLMSTQSQLDRFERVLELGPAAGQADWPQISLYFNDLEGHNPNGWRNKQDTLQMLGNLTFDAIERGFIAVDGLTARNKQFLGSLVPFLMAVGYPRYENSGSWEEITAVRSSVLAVETALLHKMRRHLLRDNPADPKYDFLRQAYATHRPEGSPDNLEDNLGMMVQDGLTVLGQRLHFESGPLDHTPDSVKYREADAALAYVLLYDLPKLLADNQVPVGPQGDILSATEIENMVLAQLETLIDPVTSGMKRYQGDSYQRTNFHTHATQQQIARIKQDIRNRAAVTGSEPDLDEKQRRRDEAVAPGREAAWTHPISQLSAWAAKRSLTTTNPEESIRYRQLSTRYMNMALQLVTGDHHYAAAMQPDGAYRVERLPAYKMPECFITYQDRHGEIIVASPHTPLNWSTAMLREATGLLSVATRRQRTHALGQSSLGGSVQQS